MKQKEWNELESREVSECHHELYSQMNKTKTKTEKFDNVKFWLPLNPPSDFTPLPPSHVGDSQKGKSKISQFPAKIFEEKVLNFLWLNRRSASHFYIFNFKRMWCTAYAPPKKYFLSFFMKFKAIYWLNFFHIFCHALSSQKIVLVLCTDESAVIRW